MPWLSLLFVRITVRAQQDGINKKNIKMKKKANETVNANTTASLSAIDRIFQC